MSQRAQARKNVIAGFVEFVPCLFSPHSPRLRSARRREDPLALPLRPPRYASTT